MGAIDEGGRDRYAITSGRALVWPVVFETAMEKPIAGHGRIAMYRSGIVTRLKSEYGITSFGHPHNAYLELFLDTGLIGLIIVGAFYWRMLRATLRKFTAPTGNLEYVVASIVLAFLVVNLAASLASQSFYPKQGATLLWIALGLGFTWMTNSPEKQPAHEGAVGQPATGAPQLR
jgi:O-antigen ligase